MVGGGGFLHPLWLLGGRVLCTSSKNKKLTCMSLYVYVRICECMYVYDHVYVYVFVYRSICIRM